MEGVAFMAARVRLKLDAQYPQFTQSLIESVYPDFLAPVPAMAIVQLTPVGAIPPEGDLIEKKRHRLIGIPESGIQSSIRAIEPTPCVFTLGQDVRLLPVEIIEGAVLVRRLKEAGLDRFFPDARAAVRIRIQKKNPEHGWSEIALDPLVVHVPTQDGLGHTVLHSLFAHQLGLAVAPEGGNPTEGSVRRGRFVVKSGFAKSEALLPPSPRTFEGYRLLREYFALPERFSFFKIKGFANALRDIKTEAVDLLIPLREAPAGLEQAVNHQTFELNCVPAVNLFQKVFSQVIEPSRFSEFHVVPDRNRPLDFEIYSLDSIEGHDDQTSTSIPFRSFYKTETRAGTAASYFTVSRQNRMLSETGTQRRMDEASAAYPGSEVFISLGDAGRAPFAGQISLLDFSAHCTNRHLAISLRENRGAWRMDGGSKAKVTIRRGPTIPQFKPVDGVYAWQLLNLFTLNYLSLSGGEDGTDSPLRDLLSLFGCAAPEWSSRQIEFIRQVRTAPITRPLYKDFGSEGDDASSEEQPQIMVGMVRGLEVRVGLDESALNDHRTILLASVLDEFFSKYVGINSFTETVFETVPSHREWIRWPKNPGLNPRF